MAKQKTHYLGPMMIGVGMSIIAVIATASMAWFLYGHTVDLLTDNLRQRLLSITTTQAANIDSDAIQALQVEEDWKKPEWGRIVTRLKKAKDNNKDIVFMYIFRKNKDDSTKLEFVADAESLNPYVNADDDSSNDVDANKDGVIEPDGPDYLQWPGQEYPEPPEEAFLAFEGPLTSKTLYEDSFGKVLTGYEPIKDKNGNTIAVLATDIRADDFAAITTQTLYPFVLFIAFLVVVILVLSGILIKIWNSRVHFFQELDRQKDELLSIVSHQLAAPVTAIKWYLELLTDSDLKVLDKNQIDSITSMKSIGVNLSDLVSMILDVSRIQLGKMKVDTDELDLNEFFKEILAVIEPKAAQKCIEFIKDMPQDLPKAVLDKRLTRMTIENLLTNAVKYTPEKGRVEFRITREGNILRCMVKDTGVGIPKEEQAHAFDKLFRASNVRNTFEGNGFGLYVAKGAIEAQGGKIWFESKENKGTTFYVTLPLSSK